MPAFLRRSLWLLIPIVIALGVYLGYRNYAAPVERHFITGTVSRGDLTSTISATGIVEPQEVIDVGAQVAGQINFFGKDKNGLQVDYDSVVETGTVLAQIDDTLYACDLASSEAQQALDRAGVTKSESDLEILRGKLSQVDADMNQSKGRLDQARADEDQSKGKLSQMQSDLDQAKAKLDQAQRDWERAQKLGPGNALSQESYDGFRSAFNGATAAVASAKAGITQAQASVASVQASISQAQSNVLSLQASIAQAKSGIVSGQAVIEQAKANVLRDDAAVKRARQNVSYCTIKSPVNGVILDRRVNVGQTVVSSLNAPSLFLIAKDLTKMQVWISVNEADIGRIHPGLPVTFGVDAFPGTPFKGTVKKVRLNAAMTQNVVTYTVEVETDNSNAKLLPYLTASAKFEVETRKNVLTVPNAALRFIPTPGAVAPEPAATEDEHPQGDGHGKSGKGAGAGGAGGEGTSGKVWVVEGNFVRAIRVRTGITDGAMTEVTSKKLEEGMALVVGELSPAQTSAAGANTNPFAPQPFRPTRPATAPTTEPATPPAK